ncbi:glutamine synthetase family protein [Membranihabitans marinus]|uniref:glutamine synthetase family protein n=1 Tax=Membranihabitans marinus TaxID=1227546 RepID=UPI001F266A3F|nr:glutamine synthetase [Membranihabitans marinus]
MNDETLKSNIFQQIIDSPHQKVKVAIADIDGVLRGKLMHKEKFLQVMESNFGFCNVVYGWDMADQSYDNVQVSGWHTGYPDAEAFVDWRTYRNIPWENNLPFFLADFTGSQASSAMAACPRSLLKQVITKAHTMGFTPFFSQEFEWFNFKQNSRELYEKNFQQLQPLTSGMFGYSLLKAAEYSEYFNDLFDLLAQFRVPLEGLHTETGPGVYEGAIQYSEILEAADRAVLFKSAVKEIAFKHDIIPSFMAKQSQELPGCSGHVHQSLWNIEKNKNLFYDGDAVHNMSRVFQQYLAGQIHCLPHILPMLAPTINSYKRLVEGAWAPTTLTWGVDNRTTAFRALPLGEKSARLESRVVGSDVNPYLAMAACLASGLYGIEHNLSLDLPPTSGNGYEDIGGGRLPSNLFEASQAMDKSPISRELFNPAFVDHFTQTRFWEWRQFSVEITDWEKKRYFEII